jgi:predicted transcriptional regulator
MKKLVINLEEKTNKIREVLKRLDLSICEKVIFIYLLIFSENNSVKISRYELSKNIGISNLTLGKYLSLLKSKKLIYKKQVRADGRYSANQYSFSEEERSD